MIRDEIITRPDGRTIIGRSAHLLYFRMMQEYDGLPWKDNPNYPPGQYLMDTKGHCLAEGIEDYRDGDIVLTIEGEQ